ncbi:hypothetical protein H8D57_02370 [bacterium]|nr:hypothetical protein [bacterium]
MKLKNKTRLGYTEKDMADAFLELLQSPGSLPEIGPFDRVFREVSCRQGRPDFIALRHNEDFQLPTYPESIGIVGPAILSLLKPNASRTLRYLVNNTEFSEDSIKRSLNQLVNYSHVERINTNSYRLANNATHAKIELWVFELKLDNPKRAVFQAMQSRTYSNHSIIVIPPSQEKYYKRYIVPMKRWGIGLATFDPNSVKFCMLRRGRTSRSLNVQHKIYALSQICI